MGNGILIKEKVNEIIEENYRMASLLSRLFVDHVFAVVVMLSKQLASTGYHYDSISDFGSPMKFRVSL